MSDEGLARLEQALAATVARLAGLERLVTEALLPGGGATLQAPPAARLSERYLVVAAGGQRFGLPLDGVQEVVRMAALGPVPGDAAGALEGLLDLRGAAIPSLCLRRGLGLPPLEDDVDCRLVVLRAPRGEVALRVDEVVGVQAVAGATGPAPEGAAPWVVGVWRGSPFVLLADAAGLVEALATGAGVSHE